MISFVILMLATLISSIVSGTLGMGGGVILLAVMAIFLPPLALIPLHGVVQFASNLTRVVLHFREIVWRITLPFAVGAIPGAYLASRLVLDIPEREFKVFLGCFILLMTWFPILKNTPKIRGKFLVLGFAATFISIFTGATGPFIAPFYLREGLIKEKLVATKAACQLFLHFFKVSAYVMIGFTLQAYGGTLVGLIAVVVLGNYVGKRILKKLSDRTYVIGLKALISALAVLIIIRAFF